MILDLVCGAPFEMPIPYDPIFDIQKHKVPLHVGDSEESSKAAEVDAGLFGRLNYC